ncbi:uncharacterized protein LOC18785288 [Prunus persica]|uniref:uncharacterized protein LOC18785288 n=1 Tax=Prunus persica TaxID=3760 RepID=UPI0009ABA657|nr:uncharacterized protein LOC18785288 [Prunus persica]
MEESQKFGRNHKPTTTTATEKLSKSSSTSNSCISSSSSGIFFFFDSDQDGGNGGHNSDDSEHDSAEVKRLREDLLGFLDESELEAATQDLDSVMKSFEEEIASTTSSVGSGTGGRSDVRFGESNPDLGYLLGASDDELGLPPSENFSEVLAEGRETELVRVSSDSSGIDVEEVPWSESESKMISHG